MEIKRLDIARVDNQAWVLASILAQRGEVGIEGMGNGPYSYNTAYFTHYMEYATTDLIISARSDVAEYQEVLDRTRG